MGHRKSNSKREVSSNTSLPQKTIEKKSNKPNFSLEQLEKEETKPKVSRREEVIKIRAEINEID